MNSNNYFQTLLLVSECKQLDIHGHSNHIRNHMVLLGGECISTYLFKQRSDTLAHIGVRIT